MSSTFSSPFGSPQGSVSSKKSGKSRIVPFRAKTTEDLMQQILKKASSFSADNIHEIGNDAPKKARFGMSDSNISARLTALASEIQQNKLTQQSNLVGNFMSAYTTSALHPAGKELSEQFRMFKVSQDWHLVLPLERSPAFYDYSMIPPEGANNLVFFFNENDHTTSQTLPSSLESNRYAKRLKEDPSLLCLQDELLRFICDIEFNNQDVFAFLKDKSAQCQAEQQLLNYFDKLSGKKQSYNYMLIDPTEFGEVDTIDASSVSFSQFVRGIFYIGKGKADRMYHHLQSTKNSGGMKKIYQDFGASYKRGRIESIWLGGKGVVVLPFFMNSNDNEALLREHFMITARQEFNWKSVKGAGNWHNTVIGPLSLSNKNEGEINTLGRERLFDMLPTLKNPAVRKELGVRCLYHAYGQFRNARLVQQKRENFTLVAESPSVSSAVISPATEMARKKSVSRSSSKDSNPTIDQFLSKS